MSSGAGERARGRANPGLPPLPFTLPVWDSRATPLRPRSAPQLLGGVVMYAIAIWLAFEDAAFRHFEAKMATPVTGFITGRHGAVAAGDLVWFALGTHRAFGLQITAECTSALLLIPLLVMMGSFTVFSRVPLRREVLALAVGAGLMFVVNILRVAGIAWSTWKWGLNPGYTYSHVFVGSAFSLIGFIGAMLLALWVLVRTDRAKQGVGKLRRAFWVATAPASHRAQSGARGSYGARPPVHRYRHRRRP
jgi:exosortase/archaeosortase family protein